MSVQLRDCQIDAIRKMKNGCILCGGVGSGKSRTSLAYYYQTQGGRIFEDHLEEMDNPCDLIIITTAHKRDTYEWEAEMAPFLISTKDDGPYKHTVKVDSWNNIGKYVGIEGAFFIFDEQRVVGKGAWVKSFLKITKVNQWILLSATPGDTWEDYVPVFIANGYFKNRTEFNREHAVFSRFTKFPKIERYLNTGRLIRLRDNLLVDIEMQRKTISHHEDIWCSYNVILYKDLIKTRWNPWDDKPIETAAELCYSMRRICNTDVSRLVSLMEIFEKHPRMIVFYNFDYELDILKNCGWPDGVEIAEWNGHAHQPVPTSDSWIYLVQYTAGCEGWNCITTDTIVFWSQNYSYKVMEQARGRIDRMNTPFIDLYYYHLKSRSGIDIAIARAISNKKKFNEGKFVENGR